MTDASAASSLGRASPGSQPPVFPRDAAIHWVPYAGAEPLLIRAPAPGSARAVDGAHWVAHSGGESVAIPSHASLLAALRGSVPPVPVQRTPAPASPPPASPVVGLGVTDEDAAPVVAVTPTANVSSSSSSRPSSSGATNGGLNALDPSLYSFCETGLLPFGESATLRVMTGAAIQTLGRREMGFLLTNQSHWPRLALCQVPILAAALYRIWRTVLAERLCRVTSSSTLDSDMRAQQERRIVAMLAYLGKLEDDIE